MADERRRTDRDEKAEEKESTDKKKKEPKVKEKKNKKEKKKKNPIVSLFKWIIILVLSLIFASAILITMGQYITFPFPIPTWDEVIYIVRGSSNPEEQQKPNELQVHFIDIGQADSILLKLGDQSMLIDAGDNSDGDDIYNYIKNQGIEKLDYLIGTHPHADHIGGLDYIIQNMDVDTIIMPKIPNALVPSTKTYSDVLTAAKNKGKKIKTAVAGESFAMGKAVVTIIGPKGEYDNLNDYSACIRFEYRGKSFLFTGDAEAAAETDMIANFKDLLAVDVLKVGHHGSDSSTSEEFLKAVTPKYAVIEVGEGNSYGHPHKSILDRFESYKTQVFRTDLNGNIIFTVGADGISIKTEH